ncbi:MAG: TonB-dependent receptor, partial [Acidobacteria bacterium]|nr:TonB-dependent receptor [Acidobacteriota bacterium]
MKKRIGATILLLCFVLSANALAQTANSTIGGTVSDATGALIPGVTVTARNTQTGIDTTQLTNEAGAYQFAALQSGIYEVRAELSGFQTRVRTNVVLGVSQQVRLNFALEVGAVATAVEVTTEADTFLGTTSSSVGSVLPEYRLRELPLSTRRAIDLIATTAGTGGGGNFAGGRADSLNVTRDGVSTSDGRYGGMGVSTSTYVSSDLVEEVRVIVAPIDAETGRGSGQVQMATRSGTNEFHGALFHQNRNSALAANTWLNNFNGASKDFSNANQFGGRLGGPIVRNKTFFFFLFEGQRFSARRQFTGTVLTEEARKGNFRFFPGVQNGNVLSNNPVVDAFGNPVTPRNAQGPLETVSVFNRDSLRPGMDTSGWVQQVLSRMPAPNNFTVGDGLNTAGIRWTRSISGEDTTNGDGQDSNRNQYNFRVDHNFNPSHKLSVSGTYERNWGVSDQVGISNWPGGFDGTLLRKPQFYSASLVSTLAPTVVNEFRFGYRRNWQFNFGSVFREDEVGEEARKALASLNGQLFFPTHILFPNNFHANLTGAGTRGQKSPLFTFADSVSWTQGTHAFRAGFETRFDSTDGFTGPANPEFQFPAVARGLSAIPGLIGSRVTAAQNLLLDLSGSVGSVSQTFNIRRPEDPFIAQPAMREFRQNEFSVFFKDDWKIRPDLTFNLGVRYDYYGVPYEDRGTLPRTIGRSAGLFGISGTSFADLYQPGIANGELSRLEFIGKNSPNPDKQLYEDDWNNLAPAIGISWSLPWWGQDKTVLRAGYGINYSGQTRFSPQLQLFVAGLPGISDTQDLNTLGVAGQFFNLTNAPAPVPAPTTQPLFLWPLTRRSGSLNGFEDERVTPYIQNWTLELQRELARDFTFEARYVGSKGTKLWGRIPINSVNIFETGLLDAFQVTRAGGDAELFNRMLTGLNLGLGRIDGRQVTGSASLRANTLSRGFLANGNVGGLADFLNRSATGTGRAGGLLLNSGEFPQNFFVANPQFQNVTIDGNPHNSTYHAMTLQVTKRLSGGFTNQTSWTFSRSIGVSANDGAFAAFTNSNASLD